MKKQKKQKQWIVCANHPDYKGIKKPRIKCENCKLVYETLNPLEHVKEIIKKLDLDRETTDLLMAWLFESNLKKRAPSYKVIKTK